MGERKDDHVRIALEHERDRRGRPNELDDVELVHHALDGIDPARVGLDVRLGPFAWPAPLYVNGMTGGTAMTGDVNRTLAIAAREANVPIASGSVSIALDDPSRAPWFRVLRDEHPHGFVMANVGADRSADDARRAVDLLDADALQVHLNAAQELVMPEGSTRFESWARSIAAICEAVDVPVVVKEVGAGLSGRTVARLRDLGVAVADVGGVGGTDFVAVENDRREARDYAYLAGWGLSTPACLLDASGAGLPLLASGGIRHPLDVVRALALGAGAVGVASRFLAVAVEGGEDALVAELGRWLTQVRAILGLVGAATPADAVHADVLVRGRLRELAELRGIDVTTLARRRAAADGDIA
ncbi:MULTISPECIES: type 2 isopentenyl-diphosphate Delta-isomerase [unclassified Agrococcus]|uniref:type 2 isopentenyl-diphosphate Delta-isomerase n=1 Tax=unclassified Agrococcus TaxID=2615065 RepID=UPI00361EF86A